MSAKNLFVRAFTHSRIAPITFVMSVRPSFRPSVRLTARTSKAPTGRISVEGGFYENAFK